MSLKGSIVVSKDAWCKIPKMTEPNLIDITMTTKQTTVLIFHIL